MKSYTLINAAILTINENDDYFPQGAMVIADGKILSVGSMEDIEIKGEVIDMEGKIVMPGLINTHTHTHASLFRSLGDDMELMDWLHNAMWPTERHMNAGIAYAATRMSCLEYIKGGITTYADQFYFADSVAQAASQSGLRCFLAASVFTQPTAETDDTWKAAEEFVESWIGREMETRIYPCIGPHAPYSVDEALFRKTIALAEKHDILSIHIFRRQRMKTG